MLKHANKEEIKLEEALDRLEKIVENLQNSSLSIEESLSIFEEGIALVRVCQEKLDNAEAKISLLLKGKNGDVREVPFNVEPEV